MEVKLRRTSCPRLLLWLLRRIRPLADRGAARLEGRRFMRWQLYRFAAGASRERFTVRHVWNPIMRPPNLVGRGSRKAARLQQRAQCAPIKSCWVRPKNAPSRGLALGHGSAHLESSDVVPRANTKPFGNMLRLFGSLAPPTQSLTAFLSAQSFLKIRL